MAIFATNIVTISAAEVNQSPVTTEEFKEIIAPDDFTLPEEFSTVNVTEFNEKKGHESVAMKNDTSINLNKSISTSEATILHNNGKPIKTDLFEKKQGNELFAVSMYTENGVKHEAYYMANESSININNKLYEIVLDNKKDPEILNQKIGDSISFSVSSVSATIKDYKWDFYTTLPNGVHRQQGSLATSVEATRKNSNTSINGTNGSVWDVSSYSQLKARSDESIYNHKTRLDVNYTNQTLLSWGPNTTSNSTATVSLAGLINPVNWSFTLGGFTCGDLSSKVGKYGRWEYKPRATTSNTWNTDPGIRVTNTVGAFGVKLSQTVNYIWSNHSTGVIIFSAADR